MAKILPYSYSSLSSFETCAKKHHGERITKEFARPFVQAASDGTDLHKLAETYVLENQDFEHKYRDQIVSVVDELRAKGGALYPEAQLCVTRAKEPCDWWAEDGHSRSVVDLLRIGDTEADVVDWKTGRADPYSTQLKLSALHVMMHHPNITRVNTRYVWLKEGYDTKASIHREFLEADWSKFENRVTKLENAFKQNKWPEKKSGLCKNFCGVTNCVHNGKYRRPE